jgi:hypothetical protein
MHGLVDLDSGSVLEIGFGVPAWLEPFDTAARQELSWAGHPGCGWFPVADGARPTPDLSQRLREQPALFDPDSRSVVRQWALEARPDGAERLAAALAASIAAAQVAVDDAAEARRQDFLTPGAGQALEYQQSRAEAVAALAAPEPLDPAAYPMLAAEQAALAAAGVAPLPSLRAVAESVRQADERWTAIGAAIKEVRRAAKLALAAAPTEARVQALADWSRAAYAAIPGPLPPLPASH